MSPTAITPMRALSIAKSREELLKSGDMVLRIRKPSMDEVGLMKKGAVYASLLDPFNEKELLDARLWHVVSAQSAWR